MELNNKTREELKSIGFIHGNAGWYSNNDDTIRIRMWTNDEIFFWSWDNNFEEYCEIHFSGKIYNIEEVKWVLERCFNK
jgi:hypothetical protein